MIRTSPFTILAIFAHPDDEVGVGSTLTHYSEAGCFTALACATRGEAATIFCDECATRENLAEVRTRELECACQHLGVAELRWLDWPDGGVAGLKRERAVEQVVGLIRTFRPDVIITHPENGLYPHPDHLAIWETVRTAFDEAAAPKYPKAGPPWATARLFTRCIPQSYFDAAPEFAAYRVELNGQHLPFYATPDEAVKVVMDVAASADRRTAAWDCHRSQHNPNGGFARMPDELRRKMAENEYFILAAARVPLDGGVQADLFAGLRGEQSGAPDAALLRQFLTERRGYRAAFEGYRTSMTKPDWQQLLATLIELEQESISLLAGALRRADEVVGDAPPDQRVISQSFSCRSPGARQQFLKVSAKHSLAGYTALAAGEPGIWQELADIAAAQLRAISQVS